LRSLSVTCLPSTVAVAPAGTAKCRTSPFSILTTRSLPAT
jgi:hypothetical protein